MTEKKRGPGRPRKTEQQAEKVQRVPFGAHRTRLQLSDAEYNAMRKAGYVPHWFNDQHGRINRALSAGYVFVKPEEAMSIGQAAIGRENSDLGDKVSVVVSRAGEPIRAYLMKIKEEFYDSDQAQKEEALKATDEMIKAARVDGSDVEKSYGRGVVFE